MPGKAVQCDLFRIAALVLKKRTRLNRLRDERERSYPQKGSASGHLSGLSPGVVASADFVPLRSDHAWERRSLREGDAEGKQ